MAKRINTPQLGIFFTGLKPAFSATLLAINVVSKLDKTKE